MRQLVKKHTTVVISGRRFLSMLAAFVILASAVTAGLNEAFDNSAAIQHATYKVLLDTCHGNNDLRHVLQGLITNPKAVALNRQLVKEGRISQADFDKAVEIAREERAQIAPRDCRQVYAPLKRAK